MTTFEQLNRSIYEENEQRWIEEMRTTDRPQVEGSLCKRRDDGRLGYCCLGLGSRLANVPSRPVLDAHDEVAFVTFGENDNDTLAPAEFLSWLGITGKEVDGEYDVFPDWPEELTEQGRPSDAGHRKAYPQYIQISAAGMNDGGFTFAQIADVFAYFGIRRS